MKDWEPGSNQPVLRIAGHGVGAAGAERGGEKRGVDVVFLSASYATRTRRAKGEAGEFSLPNPSSRRSTRNVAGLASVPKAILSPKDVRVGQTDVVTEWLRAASQEPQRSDRGIAVFSMRKK